ncbi:CFA, I fimbrial subunit C usher protein, partial [Escherichia coli]
VISSLFGWTQNISLQSYGSNQANQSQETNIYALYTQKELAGSFIRLGIFSPDTDKGNVETNGFNTGSVAGVMWGTSNALLINNESVSASPIYITAANQGIAEVWLDNRLIYSQQLQPGMQ